MRSKSHQGGVSLIEVLIAVLIFSIGLIGLAGLMVVSTRANHVAYLRTQATFLANNMAERMSANPTGVWTGAYNSSTYPVAAATVGSAMPCDDTSPCSAANVATHDQQIWSGQLQTFLPQANASIQCTGVGTVGYDPSGLMAQRPPYGGNCAMTVSWTQRGDGDQAHRDAAVQTFAWEFQP